jgi:hypothetical protein
LRADPCRAPAGDGPRRRAARASADGSSDANSGTPLEVIDNAHDIALARRHLAPHAGKAARAALKSATRTMSS